MGGNHRNLHKQVLNREYFTDIIAFDAFFIFFSLLIFFAFFFEFFSQI